MIELNKYKYLNNKWYNIWEKNKNFKPNYNKKKTYCITIPPPNITGRLHMGHAFQCTLMDILIRYYRMNEYSTLWKVGTDHAGIATQILIEQKLKNKKINFQTYALKWKKKARKNIRKQLKILGCSVNWETERFTLDKHFSYAVKKAFIQLYNEKLIYQNTTLVNWDPKLKTAISDLETIYKEDHTKLYYIKYDIHNTNNEYIIIATTRPETIFADVAIAINPDDARYSNLKNKTIKIPIIKKNIPIIYDKNVDINFGTGCLKITPAHDFTDFELAKTHNLPKINILTKDGKLNENVPKKYQNLNITQARLTIENELKNLNLIEKITTYKNKIPIGDRSNNIIEPLLTKQWYVKTKPLIKPVLEAIKKKKIKIIPIKWEKIFFNWIENIKDWCISRQIWWGHRIPIWYDKQNKIYVGINEKEIKKVYKLKNNIKLKQETDVLDTWFSSALWPFASLGWPNNTKELIKFYPTSTLITGFDIIFFWAIRMMMFGIKFTNILPFKEIYIHGLIRDSFGNKMSKTKGNILDPLDIINGITYQNLIKKQTSNLLNKNIKNQIILNTKKQFPNGIESFGVDALRLTLSSIATDNISIKLNKEKIQKYKKFCNKIWNATKFIKLKLNTNKYNKHKTDIYNKWIFSIWQKTKKKIILNINKRNFQITTELIYNFIWDEFCNWYIEFIKINTIEKTHNQNLKKTIIPIFNEILKILHPIAPYITEEIWHTINNTKKNLTISKYPIPNKKLLNKYAEKKIKIFKNFCKKIRNINTKIKNNIKTYTYISIKINKYYEFKYIEQIKTMLIKFLKIKHIYINYKNQKNNIYAINILKNLKCLLPININKIKKDTKEILNKKLIKIKNKMEIIKNELKNEAFLKNANKNIIIKKKKMLKDLINLKNELKK